MKDIILISFLIIAFVIQINALDLEKIRSEILTDHNYHRKRHQVDILSRNSEIENVAQAYSEHLSSIEKLIHSDNKYGENLYYCYASNGICVTGTKASQSWYNEVWQYDFNNPKFTSGTGHFTQLVWKGSKEIGCGAACNSNNKCYVTCNYYPAGNVMGYFANNVFPLKESGGDSGSSDSDSGSQGEGGGSSSSGGSGGSSSGGSSSSGSGSSGTSVNNVNSGGMSTAGKVVLAIFVIIIALLIAFSIFHFVYRKRRFNDIKDYFVKSRF